MRPVCVLVFLGGCSQILGITDPVAASDGGVDGGGSMTGPTGTQCVPPPKFPATPDRYPLPGGAPGLIAVGDFDGDTHLDVAIAVTSEIVILHGDGSGKLVRQQILNQPATSVLASDIDGDGHTDLTLWTDGGSAVQLLRQDGDQVGGFAAPQAFNRTFNHARQVANSFIDVTSNPSPVVQDDTALWVFVDGPNNAPDQLGAAGDRLIAIGDLGSFGFDEVAVMSPTLGGVAIAQQAGPHFAAPKLIVPADSSDAAAFGGLTISVDDLAPALLTVSGTSGLIYEQLVSGNSQMFVFFGGVQGVTGGSIQIVDVDHDGRDDIVTPAGIVQQCDGGKYTALVPIATAASTVFADLDKDGKPELIRIGSDGALEVFVQ